MRPEGDAREPALTSPEPSPGQVWDVSDVCPRGWTDSDSGTLKIESVDSAAEAVRFRGGRCACSVYCLRAHARCVGFETSDGRRAMVGDKRVWDGAVWTVRGIMRGHGIDGVSLIRNDEPGIITEPVESFLRWAPAAWLTSIAVGRKAVATRVTNFDIRMSPQAMVHGCGTESLADIMTRQASTAASLVATADQARADDADVFERYARMMRRLVFDTFLRVVAEAAPHALKREVDDLFALDAKRATSATLGNAGVRARKAAVVAAFDEEPGMTAADAVRLIAALSFYEERRCGEAFPGSDALVRFIRRWDMSRVAGGDVPGYVETAWRVYERERGRG